MENNQYTVTPLFSKVFYYSKLDDISDESLVNIKHFLSLQSYNPTYPGNAEASIKQDLLETAVLLPLKQRILEEFVVFKNEILKTEDLSFGISTSWVARSKPGKDSVFHYHSNCYYSGILYINVTPDSGDICFKNFAPTTFNFDEKIKEWNIYNARAHHWTPENRDIIFFPAEVYHQFLVNNSNIDRYSIAFNIIPLGPVGISDSNFTYRKIT